MVATLAVASRERFELTRTLGAGGMGVVYEAFDRVRNETVALKMMRNADAEAVYRLKREFRALANVEHPNLVRLYDLFVEPEGSFFTMELVNGVDLATYVAARDAAETAVTLGPESRFFDEDALRHAIAGLLRGLEALHAAGLLHRDLKPSNALVTPQGRVVVLDFGLVVDAHAAVQQSQQGITGTVTYMAPEQARGESELTTACDLYAVGVILFELLTGRPPFEGPALRVLVAKQTEDPPRASRLATAAPADLDEIAWALMARDAAKRPRVQEVLAKLGTTHPSQSLPTSSTANGAPKLVGRDQELAELEATFRRTKDGRPALSLVRGRSGIGKSALLHTFARRVEAEGGVVLSGRCYEWESVPFKGLDGLVDALSRVLAMASPEELGRLWPPNLGDLATLFPVLRRIRAIAAAYARRSLGERSVQRIRSNGFACLRELLRRLGETRPLLVVLDDVQWADDDSARGLVELVRGENPPTAMLLLGARPSDDAPVVRDLFGDEVGDAIAALPRNVLELGPLDLDAMRAIAERELGGRTSLVELVARDARGIPFAAGELVRFLREGELDGTSFDGGAPIDAIVRRRIGTLDEPSRRVLEMIAVAGEPTSAQLVLRALSLSEDDRSPIDALRGRAFVRSARVGYAALIDTAHDRIRESVLEGLEGATRADLHRRLALVLEGLETPPHERLARHFRAAGERALARHHAAAAAEKASSALAFLRAAELYALALELSHEDERASLLPPYAEALAAAGRYADAALVWLEAGAKASGADAREAKRRAAECWLYAGRIDEGLDLLDVLAGELGVRIPQNRWAASWEVVKGQIRLAFRGLGFTIRPASEIRRSDLDRVRTLGAIAVQYMPLDPYRGTVPTLRYLLAALELGDPDELATALGLEGLLRGAFGWRRGALRVIGLLEELAAKHASGRARAWAAMSRALMAVFAGDRKAALPDLERAFEAIATLPSAPAWLVSMAHYVEGYSHVLDIAPAALGRALAFVEDREERSGPCAELRLRGFVVQVHNLLAGRPESVIAFTDDRRFLSATKRDIMTRTAAEHYAVLARIYLDDPKGALALAQRVREGFRRQGVWFTSFARGGSLFYTAAGALALGDRRLVRRCLRDFGSPRNELVRVFRHAVAAMNAFIEENEGDLRRELAQVRTLAVKLDVRVYEAIACWALGRIDPGPEGAEARARYLAMIEGSGMVDPDLFFWANFPIGERPARTGTHRSMWSEAGVGLELGQAHAV